MNAAEQKHTPGLTVWQSAALKFLEHATRRDAEKGGDGTRTTREVADHVGITADQARSVLYALSDLNLVDCYDERPLEWRIAKSGAAS